MSWIPQLAIKYIHLNIGCEYLTKEERDIGMPNCLGKNAQSAIRACIHQIMKEMIQTIEVNWEVCDAKTRKAIEDMTMTSNVADLFTTDV